MARDEDIENNDPMAEDTTEAELEKLVFGDEIGFREGIKSHIRETHDLVSDDDGGDAENEEHDERDVEQGGDDLGALDDSELFFLDAVPSAPNADVIIQGDEEGTLHDDREKAAWEDSDDERIMVSLANNARLRKLRTYEGEDVVNGKEYTKRLRRQFERLHPVPEWVQYARRQESRKTKRRKSLESNGSGSGSSADEGLSGEEMDIDEGELSAKPLAKLLQNPDALIRTTNVGTKRMKLRPEVIDIQRTRDIGGLQPSAITSLSFHPSYPMLLTAGPASTLYLHRISPSDSTNPNPLLTSLHVRHTPITSAHFHPQGRRIFFSGRKRYFHIWDLPDGTVEKVSRIAGHSEQQRDMERFKLSPCGRWMGLMGSRRIANVGVINILDANTSHWIAEARVESRGGIADFAWWRDGEGLTAAGKAGEVIEYSIRLRKVLARWYDEGAIGTTVLSLGGQMQSSSSKHQANNPLGGDRYIAIGSTSGIVNIYDRQAWMTTTTTNNSNNYSIPDRPRPLKSLGNLTTPISHLVFSPPCSTQGGSGNHLILAMSSRWKRDALRLVHLPSCTVYKNWPTSHTNLGRITAMGFCWPGTTGESKGGMDSYLYFVVGNEQGRCGLWEIRD